MKVRYSNEYQELRCPVVDHLVDIEKTMEMFGRDSRSGILVRSPSWTHDVVEEIK